MDNNIYINEYNINKIKEIINLNHDNINVFFKEIIFSRGLNDYYLQYFNNIVEVYNNSMILVTCLDEDVVNLIKNKFTIYNLNIDKEIVEAEINLAKRKLINFKSSIILIKIWFNKFFNILEDIISNN